MQEVSATLRIVLEHLTVAAIALVLLSGYALGDNGARVRARRSASRSRCPPTSTTQQPIQQVKILVKPIPKPGGKGVTDPLAENNVLGKDEDPEYGDPGYEPDLSDQHNYFVDCHDPGPDIKATVPEHSDSWKTRVIIACTIAAAVEIIIILVIIVYWREIRWTMRKITCPCDEHPNRHGDHEAMERAETTNLRMPPPEQRDLIQHTDLEDYDPDGLDQPSQTFRHPSRSRTQEALDEMAENTTPV